MIAGTQKSGAIDSEAVIPEEKAGFRSAAYGATQPQRFVMAVSESSRKSAVLKSVLAANISPLRFGHAFYSKPWQ